MAKIRVEDIRKELEGTGWLLNSDDYENLDTIMTFTCEEGHKVFSTWRKIRRKLSCPVCEQNTYKNVKKDDIKKKESGVYRILALDQSSTVSGWSVYDDQRLVGYGTYECTKNKHLDRIVNISEWLTSMIHLWQPDEVGVEETQYNQNSNHNTFKLLSQLMGALMLTAALQECNVSTALIASWRGHWEIKGRARADKKRSAQKRVKEKFDISVSNDEAEAICIGGYLADQYQEQDKVIIGEWSM